MNHYISRAVGADAAADGFRVPCQNFCPNFTPMVRG
jgi:hypothetical protein